MFEIGDEQTTASRFSNAAMRDRRACTVSHEYTNNLLTSTTRPQVTVATVSSRGVVGLVAGLAHLELLVSGAVLVNRGLLVSAAML